MIDTLTRPNPDDPTGNSQMRRIEDVFDCWFESGSMPFAQVHYPFERKDWFDTHFPGDFIVEYVAQTRGWFYTLMVLSTALFDRAPFRACICHGVVLDENHQKLSKRLKNYPDPKEVFDTYGSDALRFYLVSSPLLSGGDLAMPQDGRAIAQVVRQVLIPIWNAWYFLTLYANIDNTRGVLRTDQTGVLDRYLLAKTRALVEDLTQRLDGFDIPGACALLPPFIDALNNWWIRRSRDRFWAPGSGADKRDAYDTLHTVLVTLTTVASPLLPFISEEIWRGLTGGASVHHADWPDAATLPADPALVETMDLVRAACAAALSIRDSRSLRVRLPLARLTVAIPGAARLDPYRDLLADEVNVKQVVLLDDPGALGARELKVNPKVGARIGSAVKTVLAAAKDGAWEQTSDGRVAIAGQVLEPADFSITVRPPEGAATEPLAGGRGVVALDVTVTPALEAEGLARDFVRLVQATRKDAGFAVTDRIRIAADLPAAVAAAVHTHAAYVRGETLALALDLGPADGAFRAEHELAGQTVAVAVTRVAA